MFQFVQRRKWYFLFSAVLILISAVAMVISVATYPERSPVRLSIDFLGGSLFEFRFRPLAGAPGGTAITESTLRSVFNEAGIGDMRVQRLGEGSATQDRWQVKTPFVDENTVAKLTSMLDQRARSMNWQLDRDALGVSKVSPAIGEETARATVVAIIAGSVIVTGFIVVAFRKVPNAFRYGVCAILAMIHDIIIIAGAMSVMGLLLGWEADALFVTAMLTGVAYSVQDSIVVFDRIRENVARHRGEPYDMIVNRSIMETVQRSITTQILISFILTALLLMGGETIRPFAGVLQIGLISGTYSSLFIGIPLLVSWEKGELPLLRRRAAAAPARAEYGL